MERAVLPSEARRDAGTISKAIMEKVSGNSRAHQKIKDHKYKTEIGQLSRQAIKSENLQTKVTSNAAGTGGQPLEIKIRKLDSSWVLVKVLQSDHNRFLQVQHVFSACICTARKCMQNGEWTKTEPASFLVLIPRPDMLSDFKGPTVFVFLTQQAFKLEHLSC